MVLHAPPLDPADAKQAEQSIRSLRISLEGLLIHSIHVRTKALLKELKEVRNWNIFLIFYCYAILT